jgi:hypothetical protein
LCPPSGQSRLEVEGNCHSTVDSPQIPGMSRRDAQRLCFGHDGKRSPLPGL